MIEIYELVIGFIYFYYFIVGVGIRNYYRKIGYELDGFYMLKSFV